MLCVRDFIFPFPECRSKLRTGDNKVLQENEWARENERGSENERGKSKTKKKGENESEREGLPKDVLLRFVRVNFRRTENQDSIGWASEFRRTEKPRFVSSGGVGFRPSGKEEPRFVRAGFRPSGKEEPRFVRVEWASDLREKRNQDSFGFGWASEERNSKDSFGWASEERKPKDSFVGFRGSGKGELRFGHSGFGGLLKNEKELRFELWGFLSLFPSHLPSPLSFFPAIPLSLTFISLVGRVDQRLGIEINSFALSRSNCFGFLIPDDRIDYYSETTFNIFNIRSFQDAIM
ncbi:unnamed protein product [Rhizophagus irregularis]|nr:unnamed protein product [Rhizophagus irregularis]